MYLPDIHVSFDRYVLDLVIWLSKEGEKATFLASPFISV